MTPDALLWMAGGAIGVVMVGGMAEMIHLFIIARRRDDDD